MNCNLPSPPEVAEAIAVRALETPEKKDWFGRVTQDICNGCTRQGTGECPEDIRCFYTLDKPFYRPKA